MQHYKVCCSKQFPSLFSLPQACPCCILCAICVKNAARDELLYLLSLDSTRIRFHLLAVLCILPSFPNFAKLDGVSKRWVIRISVTSRRPSDKDCVIASSW